MSPGSFASPKCPVHGVASKRATCRRCNSIYMRRYMRKHRVDRPAKAMWERARKRAAQKGVPFTISVADIVIPADCPALGIPLIVEGPRSRNSPSLDRVIPALGYVPGNVRVISDRANRLKSANTIEELHRLTEKAPEKNRPDYRQTLQYVERGILFLQAQERIEQAKRAVGEWQNIADFLDNLLVPK